MSSKLDYTRLTASSPWKLMLFRAPSAYEWCKFLDSSSGPQPNETWQDCPHHTGEKHHAQPSSWCKVRKLISTASGASSMRTGPVHVQGPTRNFGILWLRIMTQVEKPHSLKGSEKFEAYPIHLSQQSLAHKHGTPSVKLQYMSSKLDYTRLTASSPWKLMLFRAPSAYEWCKFLDSSSGPQPNETWQDCPHHSGVQRCTLRGSWLLKNWTFNRKKLSSASFALSEPSLLCQMYSWPPTNESGCGTRT